MTEREQQRLVNHRLAVIHHAQKVTEDESPGGLHWLLSVSLS